MSKMRDGATAFAASGEKFSRSTLANAGKGIAAGVAISVAGGSQLALGATAVASGTLLQVAGETGAGNAGK